MVSSVGKHGFLAPGARSVISAHFFLIFFLENFQNGRPKTYFSHFKSEGKKKKKKKKEKEVLCSFSLIHFPPSFQGLHGSMTFFISLHFASTYTFMYKH